MKVSEKSSTAKTDSKSSSNNEKVTAKSDAATGLRELFEDILKDIYWAEKALVKALPKMKKNATTESLITAITDHLAVTQGQVARLEQVFSVIGVKPQAKKCEAMEGLLREAEEIMESSASGTVRDAGIIAASQKVEHYEIASYGTLCAFAKILKEDQAANLLLETLNEEKLADEKLTEVAENSINIEAAHEDDEHEMGAHDTTMQVKKNASDKTKKK